MRDARDKLSQRGQLLGLVHGVSEGTFPLPRLLRSVPDLLDQFAVPKSDRAVVGDPLQGQAIADREGAAPAVQCEDESSSLPLRHHRGDDQLSGVERREEQPLEAWIAGRIIERDSVAAAHDRGRERVRQRRAKSDHRDQRPGRGGDVEDVTLDLRDDRTGRGQECDRASRQQVERRSEVVRRARESARDLRERLALRDGVRDGRYIIGAHRGWGPGTRDATRLGGGPAHSNKTPRRKCL